jgi:hypothetical protein
MDFHKKNFIIEQVHLTVQVLSVPKNVLLPQSILNFNTMK